MFKSKKRKIILSAKVVAEFSSKFPPPSASNKLFWLIFTIVIVLIFPVISLPSRNNEIILASSIVGALLGLASGFTACWVLARRHPLTFTERGITAGPFINELWDNIESYRLNKAQGLRRHTISKIGTGTTLTLLSKTLFSSTIGRSGSVFPIQGYFFTKDEQDELRRIFSRYGIKEEGVGPTSG